MGTHVSRCLVAGACLFMLLVTTVPVPAEGTDRYEPGRRQGSAPVQRGAPLGIVVAAASSDSATPPAELDPKPPIESPPKPEPEKKPSEDKPDEVTQLKSRIIDAQNKGKLGFRKIVVCSSVEGFGIYAPLEAGQKVPVVVLYVEPANVSTLASEGRYVIDLSVDIVVSDHTGKVLGGKKGIVHLSRVSRSPILDLHFVVRFNPPKTAKQELFVTTVINDRIKNQSASARLKYSPSPPDKSVREGLRRDWHARRPITNEGDVSDEPRPQ